MTCIDCKPFLWWHTWKSLLDFSPLAGLEAIPSPLPVQSIVACVSHCLPLAVICWCRSAERRSIRIGVFSSSSSEKGLQVRRDYLEVSICVFAFLIYERLDFNPCFWDDIPIAAEPDFFNSCRTCFLGGRSCGDAEAGGFQAPSLLQLPSLLHVILPCSRSIRCLLFSSKHSNDSPALSNNATKCFCYLQPCSYMWKRWSMMLNWLWM